MCFFIFCNCVKIKKEIKKVEPKTKISIIDENLWLLIQ